MEKYGSADSPRPVAEKKRGEKRKKSGIVFWGAIGTSLLCIVLFFVLRSVFFYDTQGIVKTDEAPPETVLESERSAASDKPAPSPTPEQVEKKPAIEISPVPREKIVFTGDKQIFRDARGDYIIHEVVQGDILADIAIRYTGDPYQFPQIASDNGIANPHYIFPGQKIKIYIN